MLPFSTEPHPLLINQVETNSSMMRRGTPLLTSKDWESHSSMDWRMPSGGVADHPDSPNSKLALERSLKPLIWGPFQKRDFSQISELELSSGFTLTVKEEGSDPKTINWHMPYQPDTKTARHDLSTEWRKGYAPARFSLYEVVGQRRATKVTRTLSRL